MQRSMTTRLFNLIAVASVLAGSIGVSSNVAAHAVVTDPTLYSKLMQAKRSLETRQYLLMRDRDDLYRQIDILRRQQTDNGYSRQVVEATQMLDQTCADLKRTELDLRDINRRLL